MFVKDMRKPLVIANWKMNKLMADVEEFAVELKRKIPRGITAKVDIGICPVFIHLAALSREGLLPVGVAVGAQDLHWEDKGAYTGCVSPAMLKDIKARYVLVGHSERRQYFGETNEMLMKKLRAAVKAGLAPVYCVGETLAQREQGAAYSVLESQLEGLRQFGDDSLIDPAAFVLAYEPIWAIGTGKNATPQEAQEAHAYIRGVLAKSWNPQRAEATRILYGGSVTPANFGMLMACSDVDGGLVGGASLDPNSFIKLVEIASNK